MKNMFSSFDYFLVLVFLSMATTVTLFIGLAIYHWIMGV